MYEDGLGWPQATANAARAQSSANKMGRRKTTVRRLTCLRGLENETRTTTRSIRHVQTVYLHVGQNDQSRLQHGDQPVGINTHQRIIIQKSLINLSNPMIARSYSSFWTSAKTSRWNCGAIAVPFSLSKASNSAAYLMVPDSQSCWLLIIVSIACSI